MSPERWERERLASLPASPTWKIFQDKPVEMELDMVNTDPSAILKMRSPLAKPNSLVRYTGPEEFDLVPSKAHRVKVRIQRPPVGSGLLSETMEFPYSYGRNGVSSTFAIVREKPKPLPSYCDLRSESGACKQCTIPLDVNVKSGGAFELHCPKMDQGPIEVSWSLYADFDLKCAGLPCAGIDLTSPRRSRLRQGRADGWRPAQSRGR
jgi:hypothetical protein